VDRLRARVIWAAAGSRVPLGLLTEIDNLIGKVDLSASDTVAAAMIMYKRGVNGRLQLQPRKEDSTICSRLDMDLRVAARSLSDYQRACTARPGQHVVTRMHARPATSPDLLEKFIVTDSQHAALPSGGWAVRGILKASRSL